jgi:gas vesicle protein
VYGLSQEQIVQLIWNVLQLRIQQGNPSSWGVCAVLLRPGVHAHILESTPSESGHSFPAICGILENFDTLRHLQDGRREMEVMAEESKIHHLAWFVAGLGVGALVGILYAPKAGRETREDIAAGAREGTEYLRTRTRQAAEQVSAMVDQSKEHLSDLVEKGKEQVSDYVGRSREAVDRGRAQWEEFVERGKSLVTDQTTKVAAAVDAGRQAYRTTTTED